MSNLTLLVIELLAAAAFVVLWREDRKRLYLLWWALAHTTIPCTALVANTLRTTESAALTIPLFTYALLTSTTVVSLVAGVLSYRLVEIRISRLCLWGLALWLLLFLPGMFSHVQWTRYLGSISFFSAFLTSAILLWRNGDFLERIASVFFGIRSAAVVILIAIIQKDTSDQYTSITLNHSASMAFATALLLLLIAFRRSQHELRNHLQFLSLSHEITAELQGVSQESEIGARVLALILKRNLWDLGALTLPDPGGKHLNVVSVVGRKIDAETLEKFRQIPMDSSMSGMSFRQQKLLYTTNLGHDSRIEPRLRRESQKTGSMIQMCIPLMHRGEALGVLLLLDKESRHFLPSEMETLESVGHVVGMSLANARNLATLTYRATHDSLTGLGNRDALHEYFSTQLHGETCTLLLFDLNEFKQVNDTFGHNVGDRLLKMLAARLQERIEHDNCTSYRLGGDEFVIIFNDALTDEQNFARARAVSELIALPFFIDDLCLRTSAAAGLAIAPKHGANSHELLRCADLAMYEAKKNGTGIAIYDIGIDADVRDRMLLLSGVADGLERDEFELYYQPFISFSDGSCSGGEALLRWHHPERGLLSAGLFMPAVEATDWIQPITHRVMEIAIKDAATWQRQGIDLKISINLSARNLLDADLPNYLLKLTSEYQLDPKYIQLEITETILMKDPVAATLVLHRFCESGFTIALDDFGTGYSSLAYLARFPIHTLKIDQSFVRNMMGDARNLSIVESAIRLAHRLELNVTAEGIETETEAELLRGFGCDLAQGYLYSRPIPKGDFENWLSAQVNKKRTTSI